MSDIELPDPITEEYLQEHHWPRGDGYTVNQHGESALLWYADEVIAITNARDEQWRAAILADREKRAQACDHQYHYFGDQQKRRRCNRCNELEPVQAEAPTASNERERLIGKLRACVADPMWANHAEISKLTLLQVIAALATQQEAQPQAEPLTVEQVEGLEVWKQFVGLWPDKRIEIVRAIEAAHGIAARAAQQATGERG